MRIPVLAIVAPSPVARLSLARRGDHHHGHNKREAVHPG
jgi:hypothetical protein